MIKFVKLTARPDTWFKAGTEVFNYDFNYEDEKRITLDEWNQAIKDRGICVKGIRVCEDSPNENGMGCRTGDERIDGEWCSTDEFDVEILN